jgi:SAM-dependent methyltransferase
MMKIKFRWITSASGKVKGKLLDIGAGTGHFARYMKNLGWEVVALEPDSKARAIALEKNRITLLPLEQLADQNPQSYDVITLWHVLEHVHDIPGYMDHFRTILKPGGVLIIAVPNPTSRDARQYGYQWAAYDVPRHLWHFSPLSIEKLLTKHGFVLAEKIPMPLDAFYVSMLSEKYNGNDFFGPVAALFSGVRTYLSARRDVHNASSIIYLAR